MALGFQGAGCSFQVFLGFPGRFWGASPSPSVAPLPRWLATDASAQSRPRALAFNPAPSRTGGCRTSANAPLGARPRREGWHGNISMQRRRSSTLSSGRKPGCGFGSVQADLGGWPPPWPLAIWRLWTWALWSSVLWTWALANSGSYGNSGPSGPADPGACGPHTWGLCEARPARPPPSHGRIALPRTAGNGFPGTAFFAFM
jgi:hypothetical protein